MEEESKEQRVVDLTEQNPLFGLEVVEWTPPNGDTAHLNSFAIATDGLEYAVKSIHDCEKSKIKVSVPNQIPSAEWFCTKLAELCYIPTPTCRKLYEPLSKEYLFGSKIELAAYRQSLDLGQWLQILRTATELMKQQLWAIYAFDQFVYNTDRHINNYLYVQTRQNNIAVYAFDFSLSSLVHGWPDLTADCLVPEDSKTRVAWSYIKAAIGSDALYVKSANNVLKLLENVKISNVEAIFDEMPESWVSVSRRDALLSWWSSEGRQERIEKVRVEVNL
jgi:hypothetical protein